MVGVEEQEDEEGQERVPHKIDQSSSGSSSSSSSDSSSSSSSSSDSSSSCSSTPNGLKQDWGREAEAQNRVRGSGGAGSPVHPGGVVPDGGDEERETTRSEEAQGVAGGEQGRDGVDGQGEEQDGPAGVPVRLLPRLTHSAVVPGLDFTWAEEIRAEVWFRRAVACQEGTQVLSYETGSS